MFCAKGHQPTGSARCGRQRQGAPRWPGPQEEQRAERSLPEGRKSKQTELQEGPGLRIQADGATEGASGEGATRLHSRALPRKLAVREHEGGRLRRGPEGLGHRQGGCQMRGCLELSNAGGRPGSSGETDAVLARGPRARWLLQERGEERRRTYCVNPPWSSESSTAAPVHVGGPRPAWQNLRGADGWKAGAGRRPLSVKP